MGEEIECPNCHRTTRFYPSEQFDLPSESSTQITTEASSPISTGPPPIPPIIDSVPSAEVVTPSVYRCKNCCSIVSESAEFCVHCGQKWPTIHLICPNCGANDFDYLVVEDQSSLWFTPSLLGILSAAIWSATRPQPRLYADCLRCGHQWRRR